MATTDVVMYDEEFNQIKTILSKLRTDAHAKLLGQKEFSVLFHEGERDNIHISLVGLRVILVVIFDERSSLGLVRLRVKKASKELNDIFDRIMQKVETEKTYGTN